MFAEVSTETKVPGGNPPTQYWLTNSTILIFKLLGKDMSDMGLDELDDIEDDIDEEEERIFEQYRYKQNTYKDNIAIIVYHIEVIIYALAH